MTDSYYTYISNNFFNNTQTAISAPWRTRFNIIINNTIIGSYWGIRVSESDDIQIIGNYVSDGEYYGIIVAHSYRSYIFKNVIKNLNEALTISVSYDCEVTYNHLENNFAGLLVVGGKNITVHRNNFVKNDYNALFNVLIGKIWDEIPFSISSTPILTRRVTFAENYWERPRLLPKPILGLFMNLLPVLKVDWNPAFKPYDI